MPEGRGWEEECIRKKKAEGWSADRAEAYCWGARNLPCLFAPDAGFTWDDALRHHVAIYGESEGQRAARALWARYDEAIRDNR